MSTVTLLTQIQHVAAASTVLCLVLYFFRRRRAFRLKAVHPILFGSQISAAVFCGCLALRAGLADEIHLLSFWLGAAGACLSVLCILLSYRFLWKLCVDVSTRAPWSMPANVAAPGSGLAEPEKPSSPASSPPSRDDLLR